MGASAKRFEADLIQYQIIILPAAQKSLSKLPKKMQLRIQGAITTLASNPLPPVTKKLVGRDTYRLRTSDYRIVYEIQNNILTVTVMMGFVVPQIVGFIKNLGQELPFYTTSLMATSEFFQEFWWAILSAPVIAAVAYKAIRKNSEGFAYQMDTLWLRFPIMGPLIRKISIARYAQTFGALFSSGIDVINCLRSAQQTVTNLALLEALDVVQSQVQSGSPLSAAFGASGEFPTMVTRMIKIGEESGNLTPVLNQVSEFYTKDVDEAVQGLITMIEPMLTLLLGIMILWIAVAVFGPIYSSFENIDF